MERPRNIALLIDADNSPSSKIDQILSEISKYGVVSVKRAYGNWKSPHLSGWERQLLDHAIRPIQQFDYTKGKNATDMAMTIDAMDLMYMKRIDVFCIVSSDCDFTPLVMRLLNDGHLVIGFGERKTPEAFVNACSTFLYLEQVGAAENLPASEGTAVAPAVTRGRGELRMDTRLVNLLRGAVETCREEDGWSHMGQVSQLIKNQASFDSRNYGYPTTAKLLLATELFEHQNRGQRLYVKDNGVRSK